MIYYTVLFCADYDDKDIRLILHKKMY